MCTLSPFCREVAPPTKFSKRGGGLAGPQPLEGVAGKEVGDFFQWCCNCHIKNKLKYEIFNDKKGLYISKNIFLCHKNSNWEV